MRLSLAVAALVVAGVAAPARADKKLDEAVTKAEAQLAKGKEDEAVKILQKAAAQAPKDPEPLLVLAQVLARLGKMDEAAASVAKASELSASASPAVRARVLTARSSMALRMGGAGEALALAQQAVQADGGASSLSALARAQARLGLPAARETAEKAVKGGTSSAAAHVAQGDALLAAHLGREAEGAYKRASEIEPRSARRSGRARARPGRPGQGGRSRGRARGDTGRPPFRRSPGRARARAPRPGSLGQGERGHGRRPAGRDPGAQEPAREAHPGPRVREPRTARGGREQLRRSGRPRPARGRRRRSPRSRFSCARAMPRPPPPDRGAVRRGEVVGRGPAPPRPPPLAQGGLERGEGRPRLGRGRAPRPRRGPGRAGHRRLQRG